MRLPLVLLVTAACYSQPLRYAGVLAGGSTFTYYVDPAGSNSNDGRTPATAYQTLSKVNALSILPGQTVGLKRGGVWRETLTVPSSGSAGSPIVFGAYGSGAKPVINGADALTSWTNVSGNVYSKAVTTEPRTVLFNGVRLASNAQLPGAQNVGVFNETFEPVGFSATGWTTNGTANADALSSVVGSPANWGSQSLLVSPPNSGTSYARRDLTTDRGTLYVRFEFVLTSENLSEYNDYNDIFQGLTSGFATVFKVGLQRTAAGPLKFLAVSMHNGAFNGYNSTCSVYPNRKYRVEFRWDAAGTAWAWRVNGVDQPNNVDSAAPITSNGTLTSTFPTSIHYLYAGTIASTNKGYTIYYDNVAADTTTWAGSPAGALGTNEWHWESNTLYVNVGASPSTGTLEAAQRDYPVSISNKSYVTLSGLSLNNANHSGLFLADSQHVTLDGTDLVEGGYQGTHFSAASGGSHDYFTFKNGAAHGFGAAGLNVDTAPGVNGSANHVYIGSATVYDNGWKYTPDTSFLLGNSAGIKVWGGYHVGAAPAPNTDAVIENCTIYNNLDQWGDGSGDGIWVDQWGAGAVVRRNSIYNNDSSGIFIENMDSAVADHNTVSGGVNGIVIYRNAVTNAIYHNAVYGAKRWGLAVFGGISTQQTMTANVVKNNISFGNGTNFSAVWGGESSSGVYTFNNLGSEATNFIQWGLGTYKSTYAAFNTSYGSATNSVSGDPLFTNQSLRDFTLQSGSPCINAGVVISGINDGYLGAAPDCGAFEKQ